MLGAKAAPGSRILNGLKGKANNLVTTEKFGDVELYLEFLIPQGSNSGVYLQGLYEVQIFDSYGKEALSTSDGGAIYHRWIDGKPVAGSAPKVNASRPPGQWQSYHVWFRAPRFDASGNKTENAKFSKGRAQRRADTGERRFGGWDSIAHANPRSCHESADAARRSWPGSIP